VIHVDNVEKRHPGKSAPALAGVSLRVPKGHVASVIGKSGAGKSTLLRVLVGLDPFDKGTIRVDGTSFAAGGDRRALLGKVGLVFQSFELFPHLSVLENCVLAPVRALGRPRPAAEAAARALLDQLGLADEAGSFPEALSGGQRQRVAIARALAVGPRVLLYDEPTSALDPALKHEVARSVRRVAATGITQIVVTHDHDVARDASDVVFVLEAGKVVRSGPPAEVLPAM
jgi:ABC-type polar amino acid transport system ATPase subunit